MTRIQTSQPSRLRMVCIGLCAVLALAVVSACSSERDDNTARVTIDMRCGSNADCPTGFVCEADVEHGPPTTMCESFDVQLSCPSGYETQIGYGQTFCKPSPNGSAVWSNSVSSRGGHGSSLITVRGRKLTFHGGNDH
jgi:Cys-rich repeat protein